MAETTTDSFETPEPTGKRVRRIILSGIGAMLCFAVGGFMIWEGRQIADLREKASGWQETTGRIVRFDDRSSSSSEGADVRFSFFVGGRQVHGTRLSIAGPSGGWFRESYEPGDEVTVFYHPRYPQHAVLDWTAYPLEIKSYLIGGAIVVLPFAIFVSTKVAKRRRKNTEQAIADSIEVDMPDI